MDDEDDEEGADLYDSILDKLDEVIFVQEKLNELQA